MDKIRSHHFDTMVETMVCWCLQGNDQNQGLLGGAKWILSIHSIALVVSMLVAKLTVPMRNASIIGSGLGIILWSTSSQLLSAHLVV